VIGSYYPNSSYDFVEGTNQYAALELLANSDPVLVPVPDPDDSNSEYLLLQRYVLVLLSLYTNGGMEDEAGSMTCNWSGVICSDGGSIATLDRTYSTVKTEPVICHMRSSLTAVFVFKTVQSTNLSGSFPTEIGFLRTIRTLNFREWPSINSVKKEFHPVLLSHTFLVLLDSSRMTGDNALTGPIPTEIGNLSALKYLYLREWASINGVKKEFSSVRLSHTFLVLLDSSPMTDNNELTGPIPTEIGNLSEIEYLYLREWVSISGVKKEFHPVLLPHTFLFCWIPPE
jgi:hypothetical protein